MPATVIAMDGPAGSGKTVVGKRVADALGYLYLDTGALYRGVTWLARRRGVDPRDGPALAALAREASFDFERPAPGDDQLYRVTIDGEDVTAELTRPEVASLVSIVAAHPEVRQALLPIQQRAGQQGRVVMVGRDIGTVILPNAELKLYLEAPLAVRVARRVAQLRAQGREPNPDQVATELAERDRLDQARATAPLKPAPDAVLIDTSTVTIDDEVALILDLVAQRAG